MTAPIPQPTPSRLAPRGRLSLAVAVVADRLPAGRRGRRRPATERAGGQRTDSRARPFRGRPRRPRAPTFAIYTVARGDTLSRIAGPVRDERPEHRLLEPGDLPEPRPGGSRLPAEPAPGRLDAPDHPERAVRRADAAGAERAPGHAADAEADRRRDRVRGHAVTELMRWADPRRRVASGPARSCRNCGTHSTDGWRKPVTVTRTSNPPKASRTSQSVRS